MPWKCPPLHLPNWNNFWKWRKEMIEYKDLQVNDFIFRFIKEDNEWVCKMPTWLMEEAEKTLSREGYEADFVKQARLKDLAGEE